MQLGNFLARLALIFSPILHNDGYNEENPTGHLQSHPARHDGIPFTVLVEGNVGSGKSTLLKVFEGRSDVKVVPEPVARWQSVNGTDLLMKVLSGRSRWAGAFQLYSSLTRYEDSVATSRMSQFRVRLMERSIYSERVCFLETMRTMGQISEPEYLIMANWFRLMTNAIEDRVKPDLIVYVRCSLPTLWSHINLRRRPEEAKLNPEFLSRLQQCHEDWLVHGNSTLGPPPARVLVLDGNLSKDDFVKMVKRRQNEILGYE